MSSWGSGFEVVGLRVLELTVLCFWFGDGELRGRGKVFGEQFMV